MNRDKILDKACKLKELADRGIDGEMESAKRFLAEYQLKYEITDSELNSHKIKDSKVFSGLSAEDMVAQMVAQLIYDGLTIWADTVQYLFNTNRKMKDINKRFDKAKNIQIEWDYDENNHTHKGYVKNIVNYDIQETKKGATLYKCACKNLKIDFDNVELAKDYCVINFNNLQ